MSEIAIFLFICLCIVAVGVSILSDIIKPLKADKPTTRQQPPILPPMPPAAPQQPGYYPPAPPAGPDWQTIQWVMYLINQQQGGEK